MNANAVSTLSIAQAYIDAGISTLPLRLDGSKAPAWCLPKDDEGKAIWKPYQTRLATLDELQSWHGNGKHGIGSIGGEVSGGLEIIDFDDGSLFAPWYRMVAKIVCWLPVIETPSNGYHVYLRCDEYGGNIKIAMDPKREKKTLIETRGEGGYVASPGSPEGIHKLGLYVQVQGPPLPEVPRISPADRRELWAAARSFDQRENTPKVKRARGPIAHSQDTHPVVAKFNEQSRWEDILKPSGWSTRDDEHWTRPGKTYGTSAKIVTGADNSELLTVFSGNAGPLSPDGSHRTLSKFAAWAELEHRGEWRLAIKEAAKLLGGVL